MRTFLPRRFGRSLVMFLLVQGGTVRAENSNSRAQYDYYFPKDGRYLNSFYRRGFDNVISGQAPQQGKERHPIYYASRGNREAFHAFVHHPDRSIEGEFGETWSFECLFLLVRLGDDQFSALLSHEDHKTREVVGMTIEQLVDWTKHDFPKTTALYSYRWRRPSAQKIADVRRGTHWIAVVTLRPQNADALRAALAGDKRFSEVEYWLTSHDGTNAVIAAPKTLSPPEVEALRNLCQRYVARTPVIFR